MAVVSCGLCALGCVIVQLLDTVNVAFGKRTEFIQSTKLLFCVIR